MLQLVTDSRGFVIRMTQFFYKQNQCSMVYKLCNTGFIIQLNFKFIIICILIHLNLQFQVTGTLCRLDQILIDGSVYSYNDCNIDSKKLQRIQVSPSLMGGNRQW